MQATIRAKSSWEAIKRVLADLIDAGHKVIRQPHYNGLVGGRTSWRCVTVCPDSGECVEWVTSYS